MAGEIDLNELIPSLKAEVIPLESTIYSTVPASMWRRHMKDAFWEVVLDGLISGYTINEEDDTIVPKTGTTELDRPLQQVVVYYAGIRILRTALANMGGGTRTSFRAKSGDNEYEEETEQQQLASLLVGLLKDLTARRDGWLDAAVRSRRVSAVVANGVKGRTDSILNHYSDWLR